ncbi:hypothetical protein AV530_014785 [Patagioenas fasciata monilis]|uniref:Uncharacterized protein n=1 Tax=Patagioenas fasciata monilis TaxID=372326 RepID=A0A1V4L0M4_PATFA|nr:hypothetical protein AV530_014785 [Patagioenas fasciata monilis]
MEREREKFWKKKEIRKTNQSHAAQNYWLKLFQEFWAAEMRLELADSWHLIHAESTDNLTFTAVTVLKHGTCIEH